MLFFKKYGVYLHQVFKFNMKKLIRNIIPEDEVGKEKPKYYSVDSYFDINPLGCYINNIPNVNSGLSGKKMAGWIYRNLTNRTLNILIENIDYITI